MGRNFEIFDVNQNKALEIINELNNNEEFTFLIPTKFISPEAAQLGYLLNQIIPEKRKRKRLNYKTFFGNSRYEAFQGAIKILRHYLKTKKKGHNSSFLCYDPSDTLNFHFNPLNQSTEEALVPDVIVRSKMEDCLALLRQSEHVEVFCIRANQMTQLKELPGTFNFLLSLDKIIVMDFSELSIQAGINILGTLPYLPAIIIWGEAITRNQVPFGIFMISDSVYQPWRRFDTCFLHSSTYGGNRLALRCAIETLMQEQYFLKDFQAVSNYTNLIKRDYKLTLKIFSKYVNPGLVFLYSLAGFTLNPSKARGSKLVDKQDEIIDFISGAGAAIRGHNPKDIVKEVLHQHNASEDYIAKLEETLHSLTGLTHLFPAVSGATAVDIALIISLAASGKRKILTFKENYGGKTLLSLGVSEGEEIQAPFKPLYPHFVYVDPFAPDSPQLILDELKKGDVGLIWFEYIQGASCRAIPDEVINIIKDTRDSYKFLLGIDEILMGVYRNGTFLSFEGKINAPDIITFSKALSDASFPVAATMVKEDVFKKVYSKFPHLTSYYRSLYRNFLGAHVANHCLQKISSSKLFVDNSLKLKNVLDDKFRHLAEERNPFILKIESRGLLYKITYNLGLRFSRLFGSKIGEFSLILCITNVFLKKANTLLFFDRCIPALNMSPIDAELALFRISKTVKKYKFYIYFKMLFFQAKIIIYFFNQFLKSLILKR